MAVVDLPLAKLFDIVMNLYASSSACVCIRSKEIKLINTIDLILTLRLNHLLIGTFV